MSTIDSGTNAAMSPDGAVPTATAGVPPPTRRSRLWLWFVFAFVVQLLVWGGLFIVAHHNPVAEVPLAPSAR